MNPFRISSGKTRYRFTKSAGNARNASGCGVPWKKEDLTREPFPADPFPFGPVVGSLGNSPAIMLIRRLAWLALFGKRSDVIGAPFSINHYNNSPNLYKTPNSRFTSRQIYEDIPWTPTPPPLFNHSLYVTNGVILQKFRTIFSQRRFRRRHPKFITQNHERGAHRDGLVAAVCSRPKGPIQPKPRPSQTSAWVPRGKLSSAESAIQTLSSEQPEDILRATRSELLFTNHASAHASWHN
jgi:hypothetical protein